MSGKISPLAVCMIGRASNGKLRRPSLLLSLPGYCIYTFSLERVSYNSTRLSSFPLSRPSLERLLKFWIFSSFICFVALYGAFLEMVVRTLSRMSWFKIGGIFYSFPICFATYELFSQKHCFVIEPPVGRGAVSMLSFPWGRT